MPNIPGADARQSRTLQSLNRFTPDGITALAALGLVLLDAINKAYLAVNEARLSLDLAVAYRRMLDDLYDVQDALHGDASKLPAALATFLATVEGGCQQCAPAALSKPVPAIPSAPISARRSSSS